MSNVLAEESVHTRLHREQTSSSETNNDGDK